MLTFLSHLSVGERGSGDYWQIVAHDLRPAAISTYAYLVFGSGVSEIKVQLYTFCYHSCERYGTDIR